MFDLANNPTFAIYTGEEPIWGVRLAWRAIMTLYSGDVIACGTNHEGLGPLQDGEVVELDVEKIGRMRLHVQDPLQRQWARSVYMGPNATAQEVVARRREAQARGEPEPEGGWQNWVPPDWTGRTLP